MSAGITAWESGASGYVRGYKARELAIQGGSRPIWSRSAKAWVVGPQHMGAILALAEHEGRRVTWLGRRDVA